MLCDNLYSEKQLSNKLLKYSKFTHRLLQTKFNYINFELDYEITVSVITYFVQIVMQKDL